MIKIQIKKIRKLLFLAKLNVSVMFKKPKPNWNATQKVKMFMVVQVLFSKGYIITLINNTRGRFIRDYD